MTPEFQPTSILQNSKPSPSLNKKASTKSLAKSRSRVGGLFKKVSINWNLLCLKLKTISEEVFTTDEFVEDLFDDSESDDTIERISKAYRGFSPAEERFLQEFQKYQNLDKMYEAHQRELSHQETSDVKSSSTNYSDSQSKNITLEDIIRQNTMTEKTDELDDEIDFQKFDAVKIRKEYENYIKKANEFNENSTASSKSTLNSDKKIPNIGESIWEFRRKKWLYSPNHHNTLTKVKLRLKTLSIHHIPKESYARIYSNFVDKSKPLKSDKKINLRDLIEIINAGWIAEERWQRAAKGLAWWRIVYFFNSPI